MVTLSKPIEYGDLKLGIRAGFDEPFYYVGSEPYFNIEATNPSHERHKVSFVVTWQYLSTYGPIENSEEVTVDVPPGEQRSHGLRYQWLYSSGEAVYFFKLRTEGDGAKGIPPSYEIHPMASYSVVERWRREEELARVKTVDDLQGEANRIQAQANSLQSRTFWAFVASVSASAVLAAVGLYLAFFR